MNNNKVSTSRFDMRDDDRGRYDRSHDDDFRNEYNRRMEFDRRHERERREEHDRRHDFDFRFPFWWFIFFR